MNPFFTSWKHQKTVKIFCFHGVEKGCIGNKWVNADPKQVITEQDKKGNMWNHFSKDDSLKLNGSYLVCSGVVVLPK